MCCLAGVLRQRVRRGFGYRRDDSGRIVTDPEVAPLVREMFARYATGAYSLKDIADWAAGAGLASRSGRPLDRLSVRKMLKNVTYVGQVALHARAGGSEVFEASTLRS